MPIKRASEIGYVPRLDGLRCFAVLAVFPAHWVRGRSFGVDTGVAGVTLFFVLSGYLITSILLRTRERVDDGQATRTRALFVFYARRLLRLSPVYFAYLLVASFALHGFRPYLGWYLCYCQNFLFAKDPTVFSKYLAHFWTLAVEEQFYLLAPVLILTVRRAAMSAVGMALIAGAVIFRAGGLALGFSPYALHFMMPAQMDTLGMGVLLATLRWRHGAAGPARWLARTGLWLGLPLATACIVTHAEAGSQTGFVLGNVGLGLVMVWLVAGATDASSGYAWRILQAAPLVFIGRLSYGMYVFHFHVPGLVRDGVLRRFGAQLPSSQLLQFLLFTVVTIAISAATFFLYERHFERLRDLFTLRPARARALKSGVIAS